MRRSVLSRRRISAVDTIKGVVADLARLNGDDPEAVREGMVAQHYNPEVRRMMELELVAEALAAQASRVEERSNRLEQEPEPAEGQESEGPSEPTESPKKGKKGKKGSK